MFHVLVFGVVVVYTLIYPRYMYIFARIMIGSRISRLYMYRYENEVSILS
jgi:hypothetical protein